MTVTSSASLQQRKGLLLGWALGLFESGLVLSGSSQLGDPWVYFAVPIANACFYGVLCWLLAVFCGRQKALPWKTIYPFACVALGLLAVRRGLPDPSGLKFVFLGALTSWFAFQFSWRSTLPRWLAGAGVFCFLIPCVAWLNFHFDRDQVLETEFPSAKSSSAKNKLILVTWDTVRADSLPLFGGGGLETPALDQMAAEGLVFDDFLSVAPITAPAHASMLSGLTPPSHGLRSNGEKSPVLDLPRLPEILANAGWATGAFVAALPVHSQFGFARGFEHFDDRSEATATRRLLQSWSYASSLARLFLPDLRGTRRMIRGATVLQRASGWIRQQDRPTFAWLHFFDAHAPYEPEPINLALAQARKEEGPHAFDPKNETALILQRAEIMSLDALLGELFVQLRVLDPGLQNTTVLLLADHGECFGEGGIHQAHEPSLFAATQRIPAVLRLPGDSGPRGERSSFPATQTDVLPTFCALAGIPAPEGVQGRNLLLATDPHRGRYMEAWQKRLGDARLQAWVQADWKYIRSKAGREWLFQRSSPLAPFVETANLKKKYPEITRGMARALQNWLESIPVREAAEFQLDSASQATLQSLGYVDQEEE